MKKVFAISPAKCRMWALHDRWIEDHGSKEMQQLVASMERHGQKHPALGRRIDPKRNNGFEIELIYGARRLAAARELGIDLFLEVREMDDRAAMVEMDVENRLREDISGYERGHSLRNALAAGLFASQADLAKGLSMSEAQVSRLLRFTELPAVVVSAFDSHRDIKEEWAGVLAKLWKLPERRNGIERRARVLAGTAHKPPADSIFNNLVSDGRHVLPCTRIKDQVIRNRSGVPLFRIGVRARAIHLILPRLSVSQEMLQRITAAAKSNMEAVSACETEEK